MKKLLIFLMVAIPLVIILIVNLTVDIVVGSVSISVESVELDKNYIQGNIDDTISLNAKIYPQNATNQEIFWKSDNEDVAVVDVNGNVTFIGFGTGYITATTADGGKTASCYFYITDTKVHQVILSAPQQEFHIGSTLQLTATVLPSEALNKNVTFKSSDENIATVDPNGLVYGLSEGYVTITATSEDGAYTDFITLAVINPVTSITLDTKDAVTAESYYQIKYKLYPQNASNKRVSFAVDDTSIASVNSSGLVTFVKPGTVNVTLTTEDGGYSQTMSVTFTDGYARDLILEETTISNKVGYSQFLNYNTVPENLYNTQVSFESNNEDVAYVDESGYLHFVGGGNATITISVDKSESEKIVKQIYVFVESPAEGILIDDVVTAQKEITLQPKAFPESSTNQKFFFHSEDERIATVSDDGVVTFLSDQARDVYIQIYANEDFGDVSTKVKVTYTNGKAMGFDLISKNISMKYGETVGLQYKVEPENATNIKFDIKIKNTSNSENDVVEILSDGTIHAVGGGNCVLEISLQLYDGTTLTQNCEINVERDVEDIEFNLNLEMQDGVYVTAENTVTLYANVLPVDATNQDIEWSIDDKSMGVILGNTFKFNQTGITTLTAKSGNISKKVKVKYTGSYPISAEVGVLTEGGVVDMPKEFMAGESFEIAIKSIFPSNTINKNISLQVSNQITSSTLGKVLEIEGNVVHAVAGGNATLTVYVSSTVCLIYEITVIKLPEKIEVKQANSQTTNNSVDLVANVLPSDTSNKEVEYEIVDNNDIAYIEGNRLIFNQNGIVTIRVKSKANENLWYDFTIEKIQKDAGKIDPTKNNALMNVGDVNVVDYSNCAEFSTSKIEIISQSALNEVMDVLSISGNSITALSVGSAQIKISLFDEQGELLQQYSIEITVTQMVEDILFKQELDEFNGDYIIGSETLDLDFEILPAGAGNIQLNYQIIESYSENGMAESIAYINSSKIYFLKEGTLVLQVSTSDNSKVKEFRIKYTGGNAISAEINVEEEIYLNVGEQFTIEVLSWLPKDTQNKNILISEVSSSGTKIIEIDHNTKTITALSGGQTRVLVELSDNITKYFVVNVIKKVNEISLSDEEILTSHNSVIINAVALPSDATNRTLKYTIEENDIAKIEGNKVTFSKAGSVEVVISTTDGSEIEKRVIVTSTMGYLSSIVLNATEKNMTKGTQFSIVVTQKFPIDLQSADIYFKIISQFNPDGSEGHIIDLTEKGLVTAISGGEAVVRVYGYGYNGEEIFADCHITVNSSVTSIDVVFDEEIELYNNAYYVTSKDVLNFEVQLQPTDATIRDYDVIISNEQIALVEGGRIKFLKEGQVSIKFISKDNSLGEKSKSLTFLYTKNLLEASVDLSAFNNRTLELEAGESFEFVLNKIVPKDNTDIVLQIKNLQETRNDQSKQVISFADNILYAENGGTATFELMINNINAGKFTIKVKRYATNIELSHEEAVYVSQASFQIEAKAYPSDTHESNLFYKSSDNSIAKVNGDGLVEFLKLGKVVITITIESETGEVIKKNVTVEYTKELKALSFKETKSKMYVTESVYLSVVANPVNAEYFETEWSIDNPNIATLTKVGDQYKLTGTAVGKVVVTVKVKGKDIQVQKEFEFCTQLGFISLELDEGTDKNGYVSYKVFGNKALIKDEKTNTYSFGNYTYQMKYTTSPAQTSDVKIEWISSDPHIAEVDSNGNVTFFRSGKVTITARQKAPYAGAYVVSDSYTFTLVDGFNVLTFEEFINAHNYLSTIFEEVKAMVLHNNITYDKNVYNKSLSINYNIYGNGYMIDLTQAPTSSTNAKILISGVKNLLFDNVVLRGYSFNSEGENQNPALSSLKGKGTVVHVTGDSGNIVFNNCIIENGQICVKVESSEAKFYGCIIRNTFASGILVSRTANASRASDVTIKDCVIARNLFGSIFLDIDKSKNISECTNKVKLQGNVRMYNWLTLEEIESGMSGLVEEYLAAYNFTGIPSELIKQIKQTLQEKCKDYAYNYNGKDYYEFGVLHVNAALTIQSVLSFISNGECDLTQCSNQYARANVYGEVLLGIGNFTLNLVTLQTKNSTPFIKPYDNYDSQLIENTIIQPMYQM